jgi:hypothetical protein
VLTAERTDLVAANKEGLCSLAGYLSIFFFGAAVGDLILQQYKSLADWRRLLWRLLAVDLALWSMYAAADAFDIPTSRRLVPFIVSIQTILDEFHVRAVSGRLQFAAPVAKFGDRSVHAHWNVDPIDCNQPQPTRRLSRGTL